MLHAYRPRKPTNQWLQTQSPRHMLQRDQAATVHTPSPTAGACECDCSTPQDAESRKHLGMAQLFSVDTAPIANKKTPRPLLQKLGINPCLQRGGHRCIQVSGHVSQNLDVLAAANTASAALQACKSCVPSKQEISARMCVKSMTVWHSISAHSPCQWSSAHCGAALLHRSRCCSSTTGQRTTEL